MKTQKNRLNRRHKDKLSKAFIEEDEDEYGDNDIPVRTKTIEAQKMSLDENIRGEKLSIAQFGELSELLK